MRWRTQTLWIIVIPVTIVLAILAVSWYYRTARHTLPRIVVVLPSAVNPYWLDVRAGAEEAASELRSEYTVQIEASQSMDAANQTALLNAFISRGDVKALVLGPASDTDTVPAVSKYSTAGIPVVVIDTELNAKDVANYNVKIAAFIGSDNIDGGYKAGQLMVEALREKSNQRVLLLEGLPVHQSAIDRAAGFMRAVGNRMSVVRANGEWSRDKAQEIVASRFSRERFGGIFGSNDEMALGAISALQALKLSRAEWPIIIGFDATHDGLAAVDRGDMFATIQQDARGLGKNGVLDAVKILRHDTSIPSREFLPVNIRRH
jgi:ribose transport system substrate-binding protein